MDIKVLVTGAEGQLGLTIKTYLRLGLGSVHFNKVCFQFKNSIQKVKFV